MAKSLAPVVFATCFGWSTMTVSPAVAQVFDHIVLIAAGRLKTDPVDLILLHQLHLIAKTFGRIGLSTFAILACGRVGSTTLPGSSSAVPASLPGF